MNGVHEYCSLAYALTKYRIRETDYKFIIIFCGVNLCKEHNLGYWYRSSTSSIQFLLAVKNNDTHIMNLPIWTRRALFVTEYAKFMWNMI